MKNKERCPYDPKDITFQAICMIEWAVSKRSLSKSEVKRLIENPDQDVFMPAT